MSADVLRQAAALMRERAEAARSSQGGDPRPWMAHQPGTDEMYEWGWVGCYSAPDREFPGLFVAETPHTHDGIDVAEHIASWHPAVALAVADWLDAQADRWLKEQDRGWGLWVMRHTTKWDDAEPEWTTSAKNEGQREADRFADDSCAHALTVARAYLGESA